MKKIVWTFGLLGGAVLSAGMLATLPFMDRIGFDRGMVIGYTTMVLAFLFVFFGVRAYRENTGGNLSFGRAFGVGMLIALVASACYVATWQLIYYKLTPDFGEKYAAHVIEKERAAGATDAEIQARTTEMARFREMYKNPFFNIAVTFLEPLPVALIMALVSAGILRTRRRDGSANLTQTHRAT